MATTYDNETAADLDRVYAPSFAPFHGELAPDALMAEAKAATGLEDFGGDAYAEAGFRGRLAALCRSLETESNLTAVGRTRAHGRVLAMIISRLRTIDYVQQAPPPEDVRAPFIGTGPPRTGTSFLQALLGQDPDNLVPRTAHGMAPMPPPGVLENESARMDLVARMLTFQGLDDDAVNAIHPFAPDAEDEDILFQEAACGGLYQAFFSIPGFLPEFQKSYDELFAWQKMLMQAIQTNSAGSRWVLKAPEYMVQLDRVRSFYPDGMIFVNHRDPAKVVGSIASLFVTFQALNSDVGVPPEYLGPAMLKGQIQSLQIYEDWRAANPDVPVVDIRYRDLVSDPLGTAEILYDTFGIPFTEAARESMTAFLSVNRHGQASSGVKHSYKLTDFGIDEDMIEEAFGDYMDRYGIERERRG